MANKRLIDADKLKLAIRDDSEIYGKDYARVKLMEYIPHASRLTIHFLWWHWRWTFVKEERERQ